MRRNSITLLFLLVVLSSAQAQFVKSRSVDISAGIGLSSPNADYDIRGQGVYAQGEYVLEISKWIDLRSYAGFVFTGSEKTDAEEEIEYAVTTNAFLLGGKIRFTIPIPYVAPFLEFGVGTSIGKFVTFTPDNNIRKEGIIPHLPFTIGLELGKNRGVDIAFVYYIQNSVEQYTGAAAVGISIPLGSK